MKKSFYKGKEYAEKIADKLKLKDVSRISFLKLCEDGCNPEILAENLKLLTSNSQKTIKPNNPKRKSYKISIRPFDSLEEALEGFEKRDLTSLQKASLDLAKKIDKLKQTRVIRYMDDSEYDTNFFELPYLLVYFANELIPIIQHKLESVGKRQRPDFSKYLNELIDHVKESTGSPRYSYLCDLLNAFGQDWNESSLKEWRKRNESVTAKAK